MNYIKISVILFFVNLGSVSAQGVSVQSLGSDGYWNVKADTSISPIVKIKLHEGVIRFKLTPKLAPKTVAAFMHLVETNFYRGLIFHRIEPGFVIQGGDPKGNGTGGAPFKLRDEFVEEEFEAGYVAMAHSNAKHSASSQFFITLGKAGHLTGQYAIIGKLIEGSDVAGRVERGDPIIDIMIEKNGSKEK
jgi:peptidyl-prolyl cis-trans isomerase B (cyclophilin B)